MDYMNDLMQATTLREVADSLMIIFRHVQRGDYYKALKVCKGLPVRQRFRPMLATRRRSALTI